MARCTRTILSLLTLVTWRHGERNVSCTAHTVACLQTLTVGSLMQQEKRKRDKGQAKGGGKNFVEEEKRLARNHGVYSGFDT